ncbi:MAG: NAD-dependent epimerase/dehydratase family protein, partial [Thermoleophilaceae bacterium]
MVTVAITGASGLVGRRLLPRLADDIGGRLVGLDVREPRRRVRGLEFHRVDIAGSELKPLLEGAEVLVHLAGVVDPILDEGLMARVNVDGTRRVLDAAAAVGVQKVVRVSPSSVYGAWPNNPVPLTEDAPLRPNPGFSPAVQAAEVERLLAEWSDQHPGITVTTLRAAPVLGPGAERLPSRLLLGRPPLRVRGAAPPMQAVHVDDLVSALLLAVVSDLPGVFNAAADGWLSQDDLRSLLPRP